MENRQRFNNLKMNKSNNTNLEEAILFIFLNKTCFNGLYRVNKKGLFNVPIGKYIKPLICDADNLMYICNLLKNVEIQCGEYKECIEFIDNNTFVYIDPPYRPLTKTSSFQSYSINKFNDTEQVELKEFIDAISNKGAKVIASNSDPKNIDENDNFFDELYCSYNIS